MVSADNPDSAAAMAIDRQNEGADALMGPEDHITDNVLSNFLSASWPTPPVLDRTYGRYLWTPLRGSFV